MNQLADRFDIGWHPNGRHVREDELGLTPARLRGIAEAVAELLIFVDDDNVLDPDYLEQALRVGREYPFLGTWGGQCIPEYAVEPAPELKPYLPGHRRPDHRKGLVDERGRRLERGLPIRSRDVRPAGGHGRGTAANGCLRAQAVARPQGPVAALRRGL